MGLARGRGGWYLGLALGGVMPRHHDPAGVPGQGQGGRAFTYLDGPHIRSELLGRQGEDTIKTLLHQLLILFTAQWLLHFTGRREHGGRC